MPIHPWPTSWTDETYPPNSLSYWQWILPFVAADKKARVLGQTFPPCNHYQWTGRMPSPAVVGAVVTDSLGRITGITVTSANWDANGSIPNWIGGSPGYYPSPGSGLYPGSLDCYIEDDSCTPDHRKTFHFNISSYSTSSGGSHIDTMNFAPIYWWEGPSHLVGRHVKLFRGGALGTPELRFPEWPNDKTYSDGIIKSIVGDLVMGDSGYSAALGTALVLGTTHTSISLSAPLVLAIPSSTPLILKSGTNTQNIICSGASIGATTLSLTSFIANFAYPTSTIVDGTTILNDTGSNNGPYVVTLENVDTTPKTLGDYSGKYFYYSDLDGITQKISISANDSSSVTIATIAPGGSSPKVAESVGFTYGILDDDDNYWQPGRVAFKPEWHWRGDQVGVAAINLDNSLGSLGHASETVSWTDDGGPGGSSETITKDVYSEDFAPQVDAWPGTTWDTPGLSVTMDQPTAPDKYKTYRGLTDWIMWSLWPATISNRDWSGSKWIANPLVTFFQDASINTQSTSASAGDGSNITCSITMPDGYTSLPCCYLLDCATHYRSNRFIAGYGTATATGITGISNAGTFDSSGPCTDDMTGSTVIVSFGFTCKFGQSVGAVYPKTYFLFGTDAEGGAVSPPTDVVAGEFIGPSSISPHFSQVSCFGGFCDALQDSTFTLSAGAKVRYLGTNKELGIGFPENSDSELLVDINAYSVRQRSDLEKATMTGIVTATGTEAQSYIQVDGVDWWNGKYDVYSSTPSAVSTVSITDTSKLTGYPDDSGMGTVSPSRLWTTTNRLVGDTISISQFQSDPNGDNRFGPCDTQYRRISGQSTSAPSVTFATVTNLAQTWTFNYYSTFSLSYSTTTFGTLTSDTVTWPSGGSLRITSNTSSVISGIVYETPLPTVGVVTSYGTVTSVSGGTTHTVIPNTEFDISEPQSYEADKWQNRLCVYTNPDASTGSFTVSHNNGTRLYYASHTGTGPETGAKFDIQEFEPGQILTRNSGNTFWNWPGAYGIEPDHFTHFRGMKSQDYFTETTFTEIKNALEHTTAVQTGMAYTEADESGASLGIIFCIVSMDDESLSANWSGNSFYGTTVTSDGQAYGLMASTLSVWSEAIADPSTSFWLVAGLPGVESVALAGDACPTPPPNPPCANGAAPGAQVFYSIIPNAPNTDDAGSNMSAVKYLNNAFASVNNPCDATWTANLYYYGMIDGGDSDPSVAYGDDVCDINDDGTGQTYQPPITFGPPVLGEVDESCYALAGLPDSPSFYGFDAGNDYGVSWHEWLNVNSDSGAGEIAYFSFDTSLVSNAPTFPPDIASLQYCEYCPTQEAEIGAGPCDRGCPSGIETAWTVSGTCVFDFGDDARFN